LKEHGDLTKQTQRAQRLIDQIKNTTGIEIKDRHRQGKKVGVLPFYF
jgi:hypothetical protein